MLVRMMKPLQRRHFGGDLAITIVEITRPLTLVESSLLASRGVLG